MRDVPTITAAEYEAGRRLRLDGLRNAETKRVRRERLIRNRRHLTHAQLSEINRRNGAKALNRHRFTAEDRLRGGRNGGRTVLRTRGRAYLKALCARGGRTGKIIVVCSEANTSFRGYELAARWLQQRHPELGLNYKQARWGIIHNSRSTSGRDFGGYHWVRLPRIRTTRRAEVSHV